MVISHTSARYRVPDWLIDWKCYLISVAHLVKYYFRWLSHSYTISTHSYYYIYNIYTYYLQITLVPGQKWHCHWYPRSGTRLESILVPVPHMWDFVAFLSKAHLTHITLVRFLSCVNSNMMPHTIFILQALRTKAAFINNLSWWVLKLNRMW